MGLILKQEETSISQPSPRHLWSKMLTQARQPFPGDQSEEQCSGSKRSGRWLKGLPLLHLKPWVLRAQGIPTRLCSIPGVGPTGPAIWKPSPVWVPGCC